ncbi:hypothetical protein ABMA28_014523 [Loxostege sticticalis]|uniref:Reverse transcriptase n=1 Tax=Loxostege sticticalis TaxID=481309 RepID=A0ABD0TH68_LOXSC
MALYGAPVWVDALSSGNDRQLRSVQALMARRAIRGYRTIAAEAAILLAGTLPWDLDAIVLAAVYEWRGDRRSQDLRPAPREDQAERERLEELALESWALRVANGRTGRRTVLAICPVLKEWVRRRHGRLTYRLTQILSGNGCFGDYLHRISREQSAACHHCHSDEDTTQHTLETCPAGRGSADS